MAISTPRKSDGVLPSIQDFVDQLPAIEDYLLAESPEPPPEPAFAGEADYSGKVDVADGWTQSTWQSFDWSSAQALGPQGEATAGRTWEEGSGQAHLPSAEEIARALDGIAHRIRTGQLAIDHTQETQPEAAIAAALAVLLRTRS